MEQLRIIEGLRSKRKEALDYLYEHYCSALLGVVSRIVDDREIAEEVVQDTFLRIWNKSHLYDPQKGSLFTWMLQIARNLAINRRRGSDFSRRSKTETLESAVSIRGRQINPESLDVRRNLEKLDPKHKEVIDIIYFGGYTHVEAADALDIPLGTLKTRLLAAMRELRKIYIEP